FEKQTHAAPPPKRSDAHRKRLNGLIPQSSDGPERAWRILVAEDDITNQKVVLAILSKLGYQVEAVGDGKQALLRLRSEPYDLLLLDCQMPELDGYRTAASVRDPKTGAANPQIPIVAMTANALNGEREKCLAAGMNDYIAKPVHPETLARTLEKWLPRPCGALPSLPVSNAVFDEAALIERLMGDRVVAQNIARAFIEDIPDQIAALRARAMAGDVAAAKRQAHRIKGAAANISCVV